MNTPCTTITVIEDNRELWEKILRAKAKALGVQFKGNERDCYDFCLIDFHYNVR